MGFNFMRWLDPGGIGRQVLNPGGSMDWAMPYVGDVGSLAGSVIGGYFGGPGGAAGGAAIGRMGGEQAGRYLTKDQSYEADPFSSSVLKEGATKAARDAAIAYAASSLLGVEGKGFSPDASVGATGTVGGTEGASVAIPEMSGYGAGQNSEASILASMENQRKYDSAFNAYQKGLAAENNLQNQARIEYGPEAGNIDYSGETGRTLAPIPDYSTGGPSPASLSTNKFTESNLSSETPGGGGWRSSGGSPGFGMNRSTLGLMGLGMGLNYLGAQQTANAQEEAAKNYREATSWTPERTNAYMGNLSNIVSGVYAGEEAKRKKSVAEMLAGSGRGGGAYGGATERLGRERRETEARALAQGALTTSAPPNYPLGAFPATSPGGETLTGAGGLAGNLATMNMMYPWLMQMYGNRTA